MERDSAKNDLKKIQAQIDVLRANPRRTPKQEAELEALETQKEDTLAAISKAESDAAFLKADIAAIQANQQSMLDARDLVKNGLSVSLRLYFHTLKANAPRLRPICALFWLPNSKRLMMLRIETPLSTISFSHFPLHPSTMTCFLPSMQPDPRLPSMSPAPRLDTDSQLRAATGCEFRPPLPR